MARKGLYTYKNIAQNYGSPQVNVQSSQTLQGRNYNPPPQVVVAPAVAIGMKLERIDEETAEGGRVKERR